MNLQLRRTSQFDDVTWKLEEFIPCSCTQMNLQSCQRNIHRWPFTSYSLTPPSTNLQEGISKTLIHPPSPVDSIRDAVLTVSPNRQYLGIVWPTTPAAHGPEWIPILNMSIISGRCLTLNVWTIESRSRAMLQISTTCWLVTCGKPLTTMYASPIVSTWNEQFYFLL